MTAVMNRPPAADLAKLEQSASLGYLLNTIAHDLNNLLTNLLLGIDQVQYGGGEEALNLVTQQAQRIADVTQAVQSLGQRNLMEGRAREDANELLRDFGQWHEVIWGETVRLEIAGDQELPITCQRHSLICALGLLSRSMMSRPTGQGLAAVASAEKLPRFAWSDSGETIPMVVIRLRWGKPPQERSPEFKDLVDRFLAADRDAREVALMAAWEIVRQHRGRIECYGWTDAEGMEFVLQLPCWE